MQYRDVFCYGPSAKEPTENELDHRIDLKHIAYPAESQLKKKKLKEPDAN